MFLFKAACGIAPEQIAPKDIIQSVLYGSVIQLIMSNEVATISGGTFAACYNLPSVTIPGIRMGSHGIKAARITTQRRMRAEEQR